MSEGTIVIETIASEVLRGNPLGDPFVRRVPIYLPPDYDASDTHYPVVFVLAGFTGRGVTHLNDAPWDETLPQRMDRLIAEGVVRPMIVVMPDCFTRLGGSQYLNSPAVGRYTDHIVQELVAYVDQNYRTLPERAYRAVVGKSSGGYGALTLGLQHPDVFGLVASHSGDLYFEHCYKPDFFGALRGLRKYGGLENFWRTFPTIRPKDRDLNALLNIIAMSACYSPNATAPFGFDLPFDIETGELRAVVWARWLAHDPVERVDACADALRSLRLLHFDAGTRDEFNLQYGARIFAQRLAAHHIPFTHEEFDDGHFNIQYRYDVSLKAISRATNP